MMRFVCQTCVCIICKKTCTSKLIAQEETQKPRGKALTGKMCAEKLERDATQTLRGRDTFDLQVGMDVV